MAETKQEMLNEVLQDLDRLTGIEGSAIVSRDGLIIISHLPTRVGKEAFSAMSATMLGAAETAMMELARDPPERVLVETKTTRMIITGASADTLLVILCRYNVNLGMLFIQAEKAVNRIKEILG
ncbi:MAG: roadblock/LC7 domain-containing protein [Candidatus Thermoplasmatota archaeon]|nr:roadblock/LC7 domain-containing protein [Candidatus Thermoplasmatota archaeon]